MPYVLIGLLIVISVLFFRVAEADGRHGLTWMTLSIGFGAFAHSALGWGNTGFCLAQAVLFGTMFATKRVERPSE